MQKDLPQQRMAGDILYWLTRKRVRNLNLRVRADGEIAVSAPRWTPVAEVDAFVLARRDWIEKTRGKLAPPAPLRVFTQEERAACRQLFTGLLPLYWALAGRAGEPLPALRIRTMKSRWGVCHMTKRYITLNTQLLLQPPPAQEYVLLHEIVHFRHPNHSKRFHGEMQRLMPDYKERKKLLRLQ